MHGKPKLIFIITVKETYFIIWFGKHFYFTQKNINKADNIAGNRTQVLYLILIATYRAHATPSLQLPPCHPSLSTLHVPNPHPHQTPLSWHIHTWIQRLTAVKFPL